MRSSSARRETLRKPAVLGLKLLEPFHPVTSLRGHGFGLLLAFVTDFEICGGSVYIIRFLSATHKMAIYRLIAAGAFGPDEIDAMTAAYEAVLVELQLERTAEITEALARAIVSVTGTGELDPARIAVRAINTVGLRRPSTAQKQNMNIS